jgi:hypothetical protein
MVYRTGGAGQKAHDTEMPGPSGAHHRGSAPSRASDIRVGSALVSALVFGSRRRQCTSPGSEAAAALRRESRARPGRPARAVPAAAVLGDADGEGEAVPIDDGDPLAEDFNEWAAALEHQAEEAIRSEEAAAAMAEPPRRRKRPQDVIASLW